MWHSCLFVKRRRDLTDALSITPAYLRNDYSSSGLVTDYRDWQIPLGRRFRSIKIWFVLRTYGVSGLRAHIRRHIELGELFHSLVRSKPELFRVLTTPAFAVTVLTVIPNSDGFGSADDRPSHLSIADGLVKDEVASHATDEALEKANAITKEVYELINSRGEIYLTSTVVNGIYAIRVVSANPRAEEKYIRKAFDILLSTAEEVLGKQKANRVKP